MQSNKFLSLGDLDMIILDMRYDPTSGLDPRLRGDDERGRGDDGRESGGDGRGAGMPTLFVIPAEAGTQTT
jgi:hypothetical protein